MDKAQREAGAGRPMVHLVRSVEVPRRPVARLEPVIGGERLARLVRAADQFRRQLAGRTVWNVSSTAVGGGVAEMLYVLIGYAEDLEISSRWLVITGDAEFFALTKRLHNQIHGQAAGGPLTAAMFSASTTGPLSFVNDSGEVSRPVAPRD